MAEPIEESTEDTPKAAKQVTQRSPFAGCILLIAVACSFLFILVFSFFSLIKQDSEIQQFTTETSKPVPVSNREARADDITALDTRLIEFRNAVIDEGKDGELRLSADDLNLAIAGHDEFVELRETFYVEAIRDGKLVVKVNEALNGAPLSGTSYYLTATITGVPAISDEEVVFDVQTIEVPGKTVPDGFLGNYSPRRIMQRYKEHEVLGPIMQTVYEAKIDGEALVLKAKLPEPETNEGVGEGLMRLIGLIGVFTAGLLLIVFIAVKFGKSSK